MENNIKKAVDFLVEDCIDSINNGAGTLDLFEDGGYVEDRLKDILSKEEIKQLDFDGVWRRVDCILCKKGYVNEDREVITR